ncbi:MAG: hypothetical protein ABEI74_04670 [Candidatus Pacearchaeota archaeon]
MSEKLNLSGFYDFERLEEGRAALSGEVKLSESSEGCFFKGPVYDEGSRNPEQFVAGYFFSEGGVERLKFLKFPKDSKLANLAYSVEKPKDSNFSGRYHGEWAASPYKIEVDPNSGLYLAKIDSGIADSNIGDYTEIKLSEK